MNHFTKFKIVFSIIVDNFLTSKSRSIPLEFSNYDLQNVITPVQIDRMQQLLHESKYDKDETKFIINGLRKGFEIGYRGPRNRRDTARNIPFKEGVGNKEELWEKMMKEVRLKHFA